MNLKKSKPIEELTCIQKINCKTYELQGVNDALKCKIYQRHGNLNKFNLDFMPQILDYLKYREDSVILFYLDLIYNKAF